MRSRKTKARRNPAPKASRVRSQFDGNRLTFSASIPPPIWAAAAMMLKIIPRNTKRIKN